MYCQLHALLFPGPDGSHITAYNTSGCRCSGTRLNSRLGSSNLPPEDVIVRMDLPIDKGSLSTPQKLTTFLSQVMDQYLSGRQDKTKVVGIATDGMWECSQTETVEKLLAEIHHSPRRYDKPDNFRIFFDHTGNDDAGLQQLIRLAFCFP